MEATAGRAGRAGAEGAWLPAREEAVGDTNGGEGWEYIDDSSVPGGVGRGECTAPDADRSDEVVIEDKAGGDTLRGRLAGE